MKHSSIRHQAEHDVIPNNIEDFKIVQEKSDSQVSIIKENVKYFVLMKINTPLWQ